MRIGVILQHYDRRNDVRKLVDFISRYHDVVLFAIPKQAASVECRQEVRIIESRRVSIWNRLWNLCYLLFGNLPGDRKKYIEWKRGFFDSDRSRSGWTGRLILELSVRLPALVDFDTYLKYLQFDAKTRIGDIDVFLGFTDVNDPHFLAQVLAAKKPLATYVYSWDHPAKYHRFS